MIFFNSLLKKLNSWTNSSSQNIQITGLNSTYWALLLHNFSKDSSGFIGKNHLIVCPTIEMAEELYEDLKNSLIKDRVKFFPGNEVSPYSGIISSEKNLYQRFHILDLLAQKKEPLIIICSSEALLLKLPPVNFFSDKYLQIEVSDIISPIELSQKLVNLGYSSSTTVEEPGTFSSKGEIFDIYPISHPPIRIQYFDDMIENIFGIDLSTQKTKRDLSYNHLHIAVSPNCLSNEEFRNTLRNNIPVPSSQFKKRFEYRKNIFSKLATNCLFENYPCFAPLFFDKNLTSSIVDHIDKDNLIVTFFEKIQTTYDSNELHESLLSEFNSSFTDTESNQILTEPGDLYNFNLFDVLSNHKTIEINSLNVTNDFSSELDSLVNLTFENSNTFLNKHLRKTNSKFDYIKGLLAFLKEYFRVEGHLVFASTNKSFQSEVRYLLESNDFPANLMTRTHFWELHIKEGFYYDKENILVLTDNNLFTEKRKKTKEIKNKKVDLFAEQLATLQKGDFITHTEHGIGEYLGLETLSVGETLTDFLVILYADNDKVYVPVYKMNLVSKHADASAGLKVASLKSNKFSKLKSAAKNSAKKLAFDLLKLQAERQSSASFAFSEPDNHFKEFELAFPFTETNDQKLAIQDVLENMQKDIPMDHLVCGDVGFGKTEIAMRATFKAVLDQKQVAILVPTTILALQHFNSFSERFSDFPVVIEYVSRFKTPKQVTLIKDRLLKGEIDVIIGTHKLLSDSIKYKDLGLVIIDEEQRFGVAHKEKLKLMKTSVDFLTLTATPIPRTLQLAFLGIRDLSLIQTPPPRRQSIKSYLIKEDYQTIKIAIEKELNRGGQVFYVHNRVNDMDTYHAKLKELLPSAKIVTAHGQMSKNELESRMLAFYKGEFQILLSTTIIESGLDIPNANTMIVNRADNFGLSQLHQLRGRIGRSDKKAYAFFVIPKSQKLTLEAESRLRALQTYADLGSGFSIASCDLEIRGAGDILGGNQSGHIEQIGLELYMELLKEAIHELKGEKQLIKHDIEISTPFSTYIPSHYIKDSSERLKTYKKLSNCESFEEIEKLREELNDIFGPFPQELENLFTILEVRITLAFTGIKTIQVAGSVMNLNFDQNFLQKNVELRDKVVETFLKRPKSYQFAPNFTVAYTHKNQLSLKDLLFISKEIANQIVIC